MKTIFLMALASLISSCQLRTEEPSTSVQKDSDHRYQIVQLGTMRRDQYMIDKQTGMLWQPTCFVQGKNGDCDYSAWVKQDIEDISTAKKDIYSWAEELEKRKKK